LAAGRGFDDVAGWPFAGSGKGRAGVLATLVDFGTAGAGACPGG
jgi:hypothetical protein